MNDGSSLGKITRVRDSNHPNLDVPSTYMQMKTERRRIQRSVVIQDGYETLQCDGQPTISPETQHVLVPLCDPDVRVQLRLRSIENIRGC